MKKSCQIERSLANFFTIFVFEKSRQNASQSFTNFWNDFFFSYFRCEVLENEDPRVIYKALPTLVRLTKKEHSPETRILAADTLAFLIETSPDLQRVAAISNHLVPTVASFLWWDPTAEANHITATGELMSSGDLTHAARSLRSLDLPCSKKSSNGLGSR